MTTLKPNEQRAKTALILIYIVMGISVISIISDFFMYFIFDSYNKGEYVSPNSAMLNAYMQIAIKFFWLIAYIISGITFIMWFRRAYYNILLHVKICTWSEGWAAGSWFVPIMNLFLPCQIMYDLHTKTNKFLAEKNPNFTEKISTNLIGWWWTTWIINGVLGQITSLLSDKNSITSMQNAMVSDIINNVILLINGYLITTIIKNYSKVEPLLQEINPEDNVHPYLR